MSAMSAMPREVGLLDDEALETPRFLLPDDVFTESGPGWRRRGEFHSEQDDEE